VKREHFRDVVFLDGRLERDLIGDLPGLHFVSFDQNYSQPERFVGDHLRCHDRDDDLVVGDDARLRRRAEWQPMNDLTVGFGHVHREDDFRFAKLVLLRHVVVTRRRCHEKPACDGQVLVLQREREPRSVPSSSLVSFVEHTEIERWQASDGGGDDLAGLIRGEHQPHRVGGTLEKAPHL